MLDPRNVEFQRTAFHGEMILVGVQNNFAYENGKRTDVVTGVKCTVTLPKYDFEKLNIKLPIGANVDNGLIGKAVDFEDFKAKVYAFNGNIGFTISATAITGAKA